MDKLHQHAPVWEKLPVETLIQERERIAQTLADTISRSETIDFIISQKVTE